MHSLASNYALDNWWMFSKKLIKVKNTYNSSPDVLFSDESY